MSKHPPCSCSKTSRSRRRQMRSAEESEGMKLVSMCRRNRYCALPCAASPATHRHQLHYSHAKPTHEASAQYHTRRPLTFSHAVQAVSPAECAAPAITSDSATRRMSSQVENMPATAP